MPEEKDMPIFVMFGALFATVALVLYLIGTCDVIVKGRVAKKTLTVLTCAVCCDATATVFFILQAGSIIPSVAHEWVGYSALALMIVNLCLIRRFVSRNADTSHAAGHGSAIAAETWMRALSSIAMVWWVIAYATGIFFSM